VGTISVDTETYDPNLKAHGPGYIRRDGFMCGISLAWKEGNELCSCYLPIRHLSDNIDKSIVVAYLKDLFKIPRRYIFANAGYDLGWLRTEGITFHPNSKFRDIQVAESLLDEEALSYSLDALAKKYLGQSKEEKMLKALAEANNWKNAKSYMHKIPAGYVSAYARADAKWTLGVYEKQIPLQIEDKITPICHEMTWMGVEIDLKAADELNETLKKDESLLRKEIGGLNVWATEEIVPEFDKRGIPYFSTDKGNPSLTQAYLDSLHHPFADAIRRVRQIDRLRSAYLEATIIGQSIKGRLHAQFLQTAREEGGTRTGRFSSQHPNLQQVPKRSEIGKLIRRVFIKDPNSFGWCKCDYSSQEPRLATHYALLSKPKLEGAEEAREYFIKGKKLYDFFEDVTKLDYDKCKAIYLGKCYGMQPKRMGEELGISTEKAKEISEQFDEKAPWLWKLFNNVENAAKAKGYIKTIGGRKSHFDWWIPKNEWNGLPIKGKERFESQNPDVTPKRAWTYKAFNRLIQGSAADQTKVAMVLMCESGLMPQLTVHDEINRSVQNEKEALLQKEIMENAIPLQLPVVADMDLDNTWQ
jgi:DNA polymerase I-like protein with 3'-5' exonuclease and polymerase domains